MRKVNGIKNLIDYLESVHYPMTEEQINDLITEKHIPHSKLIGNHMMFNLDHIDWWINEQKTKQ
ncbi:hypothetical protein JOC78_000403 [Bacillus ectoiniformans]|uniref:hypothetical protein n=1 Tax=Bacillus ectoiniformans TaxID=1494429 RepID=UPI00195BD146|nr:hypothetical protein [Bacillus ectoiniformans]MBM7647482.1 hypothetical protein [Bacillus ectoiniformans]